MKKLLWLLIVGSFLSTQVFASMEKSFLFGGGRVLNSKVQVKSKYKNLQVRGFMYQPNTRMMISPFEFFTHPDLETQLDFNKLSSDARTKLEYFIAETKKHPEAFDKGKFKELLKSFGNERRHYDIETIVYIILMQVAAEASKDLKDVMEELQATRKHKKDLRESMARAGKLHATCFGQLHVNDRTPCLVVSKNDVEQMVNNIKQQLDNLSEMDELTSLRLQMAMQRMSKYMSIISNLMKKMSETSSSITENLK